MIVFRHILKAHIAPFIGSFVVLMFLFVLQFMMKFMDQLAGKGLSGAVILELMMLNLAWIVVLAVPMAVLVATLMAFGSLSANSEITALKASGVSLYRMMFPVLVAAGILTYLMVQFDNKVLPEANHRLKTLTIDIRRKKPTLTLIPGLFSQDLPGYSMLVRKTFAESNNLEGVIIYDHTNPAKNVVITAARGALSFSSDYRRLIMDLYDGEIHELGTADNKSYRIIKFERQVLTTEAEGFDFERSSENAISRGDRELSAGEMLYIVDSLRSQEQAARARINALSDGLQEKLFEGSIGPRSVSRPSWRAIEPYTNITSQLMMMRSALDAEVANDNAIQRMIRQFSVEIHKKYSIPLACLVFVLVGAPLGVMSKRGGVGVAASMSLGFFLLYWASLIGGEKLADREFIAPWLGMWIANIVIGAFGLFLTYRIARENVELRFDRWKRLIPRRLKAQL
ncbi:MAG TPA: LptF/LptG family permease [Bacteroidota bacterium]|nr:LptF/LptG family permease [Bacteroidota bacterium]